MLSNLKYGARVASKNSIITRSLIIPTINNMADLGVSQVSKILLFYWIYFEN